MTGILILMLIIAIRNNDQQQTNDQWQTIASQPQKAHRSLI